MGEQTPLCAPSGTDVESRAFTFLTWGRFGLIFNYFLCGFIPGFMANPQNVYMVKTLDGSPSAQNTMTLLMTLPWSFKLFFGLQSDLLPVCGYRRKGYLVIGLCLEMAGLATMGGLALATMLSPAAMSWLAFVSTVGMLLSDVMADTFCVELSKEYNEVGSNISGNIQSIAYLVRFGATMLGTMGGTFLFNQASWGWGLDFHWFCFISTALLLLGLPWAWALDELKAQLRPAADPLRVQLGTLWQTVQQKAVWKPLLYIYFYNALQIPNAAWNSFLLKGLNFTSFELGMLGVIAAVMSFLALLVYRSFFFHMNFRVIYVICTVLNVLFSGLQLLLIYRVNTNMGIPDFWFSLGDNVFAAFLTSFQFVPTLTLMIAMCPDDQEGASFAMFTTQFNVAQSVALVIGSGFVKIWDCSNQAMENKQFSGVGNLTILTTAIQLVPIFFVRNLPGTREEQRKDIEDGETNSIWGGVFVVVLVGSIALSLGNSLMEFH